MADSIFGRKPNQVPRCSDLGQLAFMDLTQLNFGYLDAREQQANNTQGGTATANTFHTRTLNTILFNTINGASLSSNTVTLPPGAYYCEAESPSYAILLAKLSIFNTTDNVDLIVGRSGGSGLSSFETVSGQIVLTATKGIRLRHFIFAGRATDGLGQATGSGQIEVYSSLRVWRLPQ